MEVTMQTMILKNYLENLKERRELDVLFGHLLQVCGYSIQMTPAQGQSEYGKDYVAVEKQGKVKTLVFFQLKAHNDKDINREVFNKKNGVRHSLQEAKDTGYIDESIPELKGLSLKVILVHSGTLKQDFLHQFNGFIRSEFNNPNQPTFERWDIDKLTELFSKHLFNEYLFTPNQCNLNLLKTSLALIGSADNDYYHFKQLINNILGNCTKIGKKNLKRLFSTLALIGQLTLKYAEESDNLYPAKECWTYLLLNTWGWILEKKLEKSIVREESFVMLYYSHFITIDRYLCKFRLVFFKNDGMFSPNNGEFESIAYPLRCCDMINYLIYHYRVSEELSQGMKEHNVRLADEKDIILNFLSMNEGCMIPLLDNFSITFINVVDFLIEIERVDLAESYINRVLNNLAVIKTVSRRLPELRNSLGYLIEFKATGGRPPEYCDSSSYLIEIIFEYAIKLGLESLIDEYWNRLLKNENNIVHLLVYHPPEDIVENEHILYQKELFKEGFSAVFPANTEYIETNLDKIKDEFKMFIKADKYSTIKTRTSKVGLGCLEYLSRLYYSNPYFPCHWRSKEMDTNS